MRSDTLNLILIYTKKIMKAWFQYRTDALLRSLTVFLREATGIIVIYFTLLKFDSLNGWNMRKFAGYPVSLFQKPIQILMIYIVPFAFVNYFPSQYLLRKEDMQLYPEVFLYLTPIIGIGMYIGAYFFWRYSIRFYKSSGN